MSVLIIILPPPTPTLPIPDAWTKPCGKIPPLIFVAALLPLVLLAGASHFLYSRYEGDALRVLILDKSPFVAAHQGVVYCCTESYQFVNGAARPRSAFYAVTPTLWGASVTALGKMPVSASRFVVRNGEIIIIEKRQEPPLLNGGFPGGGAAYSVAESGFTRDPAGTFPVWFAAPASPVAPEAGEKRRMGTMPPVPYVYRLWRIPVQGGKPTCIALNTGGFVSEIASRRGRRRCTGWKTRTAHGQASRPERANARNFRAPSF